MEIKRDKTITSSTKGAQCVIRQAFAGEKVGMNSPLEPPQQNGGG